MQYLNFYLSKKNKFLRYTLRRKRVSSPCKMNSSRTEHRSATQYTTGSIRTVRTTEHVTLSTSPKFASTYTELAAGVCGWVWGEGSKIIMA